MQQDQLLGKQADQAVVSVHLRHLAAAIQDPRSVLQRRVPVPSVLNHLDQHRAPRAHSAAVRLQDQVVSEHSDHLRGLDLLLANLLLARVVLLVLQQRRLHQDLPSARQASALLVEHAPFQNCACLLIMHLVGSGATTSSPFGQSAASGPSAFGSTSSTTSAFGQTSTPATSAFGQSSQPSAFGKPAAPSASPFGQPAASATTSAFGQPAQPASASAFGQTSAFGANSSAATPAKPAFGSTSGFGAFSSSAPTGSAFGQPSTSTTGKSWYSPTIGLC